MKRVIKIVLAVLVALLALIGLVLIVAFVNYPSEYVLRVLRWGFADVYDYQKFPERAMGAGATTFRFDQGDAEDKARVQGIFQADPRVENLEAFLEDTGTQAFLVIQDDQILYENYFNGASRDSIVTSFSMAKSFGSALIGIAIEEGYINSVDDPITDYLPELAARDPDFEKITIQDLLLMSSGIEYAEFPFLNGDDSKTYYYPDLRTLALNDTEIVDPPNTYFLYNNFHPLLLGMIIERTTGKRVADYLEKKIWVPMETEFPGSWSLDSEATQFEKMESGINGRAIDFAKFGRLFLEEGNWNGEQLIPSQWVIESTRPDETLDYTSYYPPEFIFESEQGYYKYFWWGMRRGENDVDPMALGNNGQFIYLSPHKDLIIVRHGERYGIDTSDWVDLFYSLASDI